jgi:hypothetical protein
MHLCFGKDPGHDPKIGAGADLDWNLPARRVQTLRYTAELRVSGREHVLLGNRGAASDGDQLSDDAPLSRGDRAIELDSRSDKSPRVGARADQVNLISRIENRSTFDLDSTIA